MFMLSFLRPGSRRAVIAVWAGFCLACWVAAPSRAQSSIGLPAGLAGPSFDETDGPAYRPLGLLYPQSNACRQATRLDGVWDFKADPQALGFAEKWFAKPLEGTRPMAVPASYNDETEDAAVRDLAGWAWYEKTAWFPLGEGRVTLRFGAVSHRAVVWVNGREVARHKGGFLPFEAELKPSAIGVSSGAGNQPLRITVAVDNRLDWASLPPGQIAFTTATAGRRPSPVQIQKHDFYNFAGIHRPVWLCVTPRGYIQDVAVTPGFAGSEGRLRYAVKTAGASGRRVRVTLLDRAGRAVASAEGAQGMLSVPNAHAWSPGSPYLYRLVTELRGALGGGPRDTYELPVGLRVIQVTERQLLLNGKPIYLRGCCKHEDEAVRGKGLDEAMLVKDFNLLRWLGANSVRTSHYPYAEEFYQMADREGILVIDEAPCVGLNVYWKGDLKKMVTGAQGERLLAHHLAVEQDMILRDRNHPCVIAWSVANEAATDNQDIVPYFRRVAARVRGLDPSRPVTIIESTACKDSTCGQFFDFIGINRYYAWYSECGQLEAIRPLLADEMRAWHAKYRKPIYLSEFGADTIAGMHSDPPQMFSEEYQAGMLKEYCETLDTLDFVIGEQVWNFADFATGQEVRRVMGNRKGIFTRDRQPKMAAHYLRERWTALARAGK